MPGSRRAVSRPTSPSTRALGLGAIVTCALGVLGGPAAAQSVDAVVDGMLAALERQAEGIDDYTIVQRAMGIETRSTFVKTVVDGRTTFVPSEVAGPDGMRADFGDGYGFGDVADFGGRLREHGRHAGMDEIEGAAVHVIEIDDAAAFGMETPSAPDGTEFRLTTGTIWVDAALFVPRRMAFDGEADGPQGPAAIATVIDMTDFRDESGLVLPYRTVVAVRGLGAMLDPEQQAQLAQLRAQLESVPEAQRAMVERMMGPQLEALERMAQGEDAPMTIEVEVVEVLVNTGGGR